MEAPPIVVPELANVARYVSVESCAERQQGPQKKVFDWSDAHGDLPIWEREVTNRRDLTQPTRIFVAMSWETFWTHYRTTPAADRNWYELIREGRHCNLYIDAEFDTKHNTHITAGQREAMSESLKAEILKDLWSHHGVAPENVHVIELDASNPSKFSRHYIFRVTGTVWASNAPHMEHFMKRLNARLETEEKEATELIAPVLDGDLTQSQGATEGPGFSPASWCIRALGRPSLFVNKEYKRTGVIKICLADLAVYTANRIFRLYRSTKRDKVPARFLCSTAELQADPASAWQGPVDRQTFFDSLVTYWPLNYQVTRILQCTWSGLAGRGIKRMPTTGPLGNFVKRHMGGGSDGPIPPICEQIIAELFPISVSNVVFNTEDALLRVSLRSKVCAIAEREHSGNHIYYMVDLWNRCFWQKCHNVVCGLKRSPRKPIPHKFEGELQHFFTQEWKVSKVSPHALWPWAVELRTKK